MSNSDPRALLAAEAQWSATARATPETTLSVRELTTALIEGLPRTYKLILALRYQEDCSFAEIACILDMNEIDARRLHAQAMTSLRQSVPTLGA